MKEIEHARQKLKEVFEALEDKKAILRSTELKALFDGIRLIEPERRGEYGKALNALKTELQEWVETASTGSAETQSEPIDVTAPWDINTPSDLKPRFLSGSIGSGHPLMQEIEIISDIYQRMGFVVEESRELDDEYHMFTSLNFPAGHPARDDYDTFVTDEGFVAPAHTSTMQNRMLKKYRHNLEAGEAIAVIIPDRVFRNEDVDATHEHTFYQIEGIYVGCGVVVGNLIATLKTYMSEYYGEELNVKIQPFYFPFTEPSFEFAVERPAGLRKDDSEEQKWLELGGCGMIHPNVLKEAGIDPATYTGFAWGFGIERMVMMKHGIEDVRHFKSGNLRFLRQFS